jgi:hypothetical protein
MFGIRIAKVTLIPFEAPLLDFDEPTGLDSFISLLREPNRIQQEQVGLLSLQDSKKLLWSINTSSSLN